MTPPVARPSRGTTGLRRALGHPTTSRVVENVTFAIGVLLGAGYVVLVEILPDTCYALSKCANAPTHPAFPWGMFAILALLVAPKTLGRVTAGKVWTLFAGRVGGGPST